MSAETTTIEVHDDGGKTYHLPTDEQGRPLMALDQITPSKTNPRKSFGGLDELAQSIRSHGILQAVIVRPRGKSGFELVAGERRYRASKLAKVDRIPVVVRDLDDQAALELQLVENAQREDVSAIEEADTYKRLQVEHGLTVDQIVEKVGKKRATVGGRLKLAELGQNGRKALAAGKISASVAGYLARLALRLQDEGLKKLLEYRGGGEDGGLSARDAAHVLSRYHLPLATAPFEPGDTQLVPKAGACGPCPKRAGNAKELYPDIKDPETCTDPDCYEAKADAQWKLRVEEAKAEGQTVLSEADAKRVFESWGDSKADHVRAGAGYVDLDAAMPSTFDGIDVRDKFKKKKVKLEADDVVLARGPRSRRIFELVDAGFARKAIGGGERRGGGGLSKAERKKRALAKAEQKAVSRRLELAWPLLVAAAKKAGTKVAPEIVQLLVDEDDGGVVSHPGGRAGTVKVDKRLAQAAVERLLERFDATFFDPVPVLARVYKVDLAKLEAPAKSGSGSAAKARNASKGRAGR